MKSWKRTLAAGLCTVALVAGAAPAGADQVVNTLDNTVDNDFETLDLTAGGTAKGTYIWLNATRETAETGNPCNIESGKSLVLNVQSSNTNAATVPKQITIKGCDELKKAKNNGAEVLVTPHAAGTSNITFSRDLSSTAMGAYTMETAGFRVSVAAAPAPPNTSPTVSVTGVADGASYQIGSIPAAGCDVVDAEDGNKAFPATLSAIDGAHGIGSQTANCSYTDGGGSSASASATYSVVDTIAPFVTVTGFEPGQKFELGVDSLPIVGCDTQDSGSGVKTAASRSSEGDPLAVGTIIVTCGGAEDNAGNKGSASASYSIVDTIAPIVTVTGFTAGQQFVYGVDPLPTVGCTTVDAGSGVATAASATSSGGPLGTITVTCDGAVDEARNSTGPVSKSYRVVYGRAGGIGQPINADGTSQFSQKRAVPVKFALQGDAPSGFAVDGFKLYRSAVSCGGGAEIQDETAAQPVSTSTTWRYDSVEDQYVFNASLAGTTAGKCYQYQVELGDGGPRVTSATFKVAK